MTEAFDLSSRYYDLLYRDKDYAQETEYLCNLIKRDCAIKNAPAPSSLLELGCGTGGHALWLTQRGCNVVGVDMSARMLERAEKRFASKTTKKVDPVAGFFKSHLGDIRSFRVNQKFDAVASLFHVASYQVSNSDVANYFQTASIHLKPGGLFVFDLWYGPAVLTQLPATRVKRVSDDQIDVVRIAEPKLIERENKVEVKYTIYVTDRKSQHTQRLEETHSMRYFFEPELDNLASQHGLEIASQEEWMTGETPSRATWGVVFTARKRD
ncbi:class I SAM-dependent DNA methyltransferase [Rhodopirellula sallentina]|uniref:Type 11 methyltransferase n=1 Tax=Rhodopirellula sallentina SM41 TaxID=1263870 RepID=M5TZU9_9BACT|nr:class I SAM-dependent methyltransferase [Rhodopirellula sallentina]EMI54710.1 type 11 methyltransferase [Rhodopirellula sallentina SM41]